MAVVKREARASVRLRVQRTRRDRRHSSVVGPAPAAGGAGGEVSKSRAGMGDGPRWGARRASLANMRDGRFWGVRRPCRGRGPLATPPARRRGRPAQSLGASCPEPWPGPWPCPQLRPQPGLQLGAPRHAPLAQPLAEARGSTAAQPMKSLSVSQSSADFLPTTSACLNAASGAGPPAACARSAGLAGQS